MMFKKAVKTEAKLRLSIAGPSGSGKTYTALAVGTALAEPGRVALLDTEHGSASKYADLFDFDVLEVAAPYHPDKVTAAIREAGEAGYAVLILDSLSHFWNGPGGMTDIVDDIARRMKSPNSFAAWKDGTPIQQRMVEAIVSAPMHIIGTMRSKQEYVLETGSDGKQRPRKVGMAPVQRDGFEYEFDVFLDMDLDNVGSVAKTRCPELTNAVIRKPGRDLADTLREWLKGAPAQAQQPAQPVSHPEPTGEPERVVFAQLPDDEMAVNNADAAYFLPTVAALLDTDEDNVKEQMKRLGYTGISRKPEERLAAYRKLRQAKLDAETTAMFLQMEDDDDARQAALLTATGQMGD